MDKFLFIVTIILAFAWCCLAGFGGPGWESDPNMRPIRDAVCDVNKRPDQTQWTELLKCRSYNKTGDPRHEKIAEMMKGVFANCSKIADDLPEALRATDEERMKTIFMFCSHKFEECKMNAIHQFHDQSHDKHNPEEWKKRREEKIACAKKALGLS